MASHCPLLRMPDDLIREILDRIESDPDKLIKPDRRGYLSQESFAVPPPSLPDQTQAIANFRLVCRRFSQIGAIHQFARIATRFSIDGLDRLEKIARNQRLAKHVKKFSYLIPNFFVEGRERVRDILPEYNSSLGLISAASFDRKAREQRQIVQSARDVAVLSLAIDAFSSLQHIQILRVQDDEDSLLIGHLRHNLELNSLVELQWAPACSHCSKTLATALLKSQSPCSRFSVPALAIQTPSVLVMQMPQSLIALAKNLTSLELHFVDGVDLDSRMRDLSPFFRTVFEAATNMQAIHIGFPSHRPISLKLEEIFHHVRWEKLIAFGIQAWQLDASEIVDLATRHRDRLRGLRLRDVLLNDGSRWATVLAALRDDMPQLDWVSLRRIGYTAEFERRWRGLEVPDDIPGGASDSEESEDTAPLSDPDDDGDDSGDEDSSNDSQSITGSEGDDEYGPNAHDMSFPRMPSDASAVQRLRSHAQTDELVTLTVDQLGDDGEGISNAQRKLWERWVVGSRGM